MPIEYEIDKKLGISGRDAVMQMGIEKYNAECKAIVMKHATEWRDTIERLGRWIDFDNDYKVGGNPANGTHLLSGCLCRHSQWTSLSWNHVGGYSSSSSTRIRYTEHTK